MVMFVNTGVDTLDYPSEKLLFPELKEVVEVVEGQETIGVLRKIIDMIWIPFLNSLPADFGHKAFKKTSRDGSQVSKAARTYAALEIFYLFDGKMHFNKGVFDGVFTYVWQNIHNVQAVRNRKKILDRIARERNLSTWVSLGSGSARSALEFKRDYPEKDLMLIDLSRDALQYSKGLAKKLDVVDERVAWHRDIAHNFPKYLKREDGKSYFFEMVGLLDYFKDRKALEFFSILSSWMSSGDVLVVSNIAPNAERSFAERIIKWTNMIYRTPQEFYDLLRVGFSDCGIELVVDATNIYTVATVTKL